jgi:predicted amidohydrolase YtcJ
MVRVVMLLALAVIFWMGAQPGCSSAPDRGGFVMTNGKVYTVNEKQPWAEAVVVKGKKIVYVGDNAGAAAFKGEGMEEIDLKGRLMLPGFVESHIHIGMGAGTTSGVILESTDSLEEVLTKVKKYAEENPDKKTIFGATYSAFIFDEKGPRKELLDEIVPDRSVYLMDHTLHAAWVNSKAYEVAGITKDTPSPAGGEYVKNEEGELSGSVKGGPAHLPILVKTEAITSEAIMESLPLLLEGMSEFGFTAAIDMGAPFATEAIFDSYVAMDQAGKLPFRLSVTYYINNEELAKDAPDKLDEYAARWKSEHVWIDNLKITIDSVVENQKAAVLEPYLNTGECGSLYLGTEAMEKVCLEVAKRGYGITVHAIGDRGVREALNAAEVLRKAGFNDTRFSTTHSQMVDPADRPRYKELDVDAQTTGNWAVAIEANREVLGQERHDTVQFPFRSWADDGVTIALGSDWPATPGGFEHGMNPFNNIYTAMHRKAPPGLEAVLGQVPGEILSPTDQVLTLAEAVAAYTIGGAKMLGIEDEVGTIEVGKKADLILLDQNLFEIDPDEIPKTKVLGTMFDGRIVHDVLYGIGDSELVDLDVVGEGATGPCSRDGGDHGTH